MDAYRAALVGLFPELASTFLDVGVIGRAVREGRLAYSHFNPRDYATDVRKTVDDRPFGGGPGMVMMVEPLRLATRDARQAVPQGSPVILLSPQGRRFDQRAAAELAGLPGLVLIAARYEGVDERFTAREVDDELSIGDYVISGGELAAAVVLDAVARLIPGVLGNPESAASESHVDGLLDYPHYTRPEFDGEDQAPPVLLSGDHAAVAAWRRREALGRTWRRRAGALLDRELSPADRELLASYINESATNDNGTPR
ncbi:MAG: tRNA (guanosine(37)-N1)-methyltransferase TrmD [Gammaproteobacteria bacterium]|nr:tRNA (guanosine(37)-N1)-methyltransferase TrmD [Gammaproteobacteria bacterium]